MKDKITTSQIRRVKQLRKFKLNGGKLVNGLNVWDVGVVRYCAGKPEWTKEELLNIDRKTRKIMAMNESMETTSNIARFYPSSIYSQYQKIFRTKNQTKKIDKIHKKISTILSLHA